MERKYKFVSNRTLKNSREEEKGKMRVFVKVDSDVAETNYRCPECGFEEHVEIEWKRPFSVRCSKCGFVMRLPKLKDEIKREKKKKA